MIQAHNVAEHFMEMLGYFFPFSPQVSQELTRTSLLTHFDLLREEVDCVLVDNGNSFLQDEMKVSRQGRLFVKRTL